MVDLLLGVVALIVLVGIVLGVTGVSGLMFTRWKR